jgi:hypothetical protein
MFDLATQKKLDAMRFNQCEICKRWFLVRGVPGSKIATLKKHLATHGK